MPRLFRDGAFSLPARFIPLPRYTSSPLKIVAQAQVNPIRLLDVLARAVFQIRMQLQVLRYRHRHTRTQLQARTRQVVVERVVVDEHFVALIELVGHRRLQVRLQDAAAFQLDIAPHGSTEFTDHRTGAVTLGVQAIVQRVALALGNHRRQLAIWFNEETVVQRDVATDFRLRAHCVLRIVALAFLAVAHGHIGLVVHAVELEHTVKVEPALDIQPGGVTADIVAVDSCTAATVQVQVRGAVTDHCTDQPLAVTTRYRRVGTEREAALRLAVTQAGLVVGHLILVAIGAGPQPSRLTLAEAQFTHAGAQGGHFAQQYSGGCVEQCQHRVGARADHLAAWVEQPVLAVVVIDQAVGIGPDIHAIADQAELGATVGGVYDMQAVIAQRVSTAAGDQQFVVARRRAGHIKEIAAQGGEIRAHDEGAVARQVGHVQLVERTGLAELDVAATQGQVTHLLMVDHHPGGVAVDRQFIDVLQAPGEDRAVVQADTGATAIVDHIALPDGAIKAQVEGAVGAYLDVAGQGAVVDTHVGIAAAGQLQHVAVAADQRGAVVYIDLGGNGLIHQNGRAAHAFDTRTFQHQHGSFVYRAMLAGHRDAISRPGNGTTHHGGLAAHQLQAFLAAAGQRGAVEQLQMAERRDRSAVGGTRDLAVAHYGFGADILRQAAGHIQATLGVAGNLWV